MTTRRLHRTPAAMRYATRFQWIVTALAFLLLVLAILMPMIGWELSGMPQPKPWATETIR